MIRSAVILMICLWAGAGLAAPAGPARAGDGTLNLHPYCLAEQCPGCPQPLDLATAPPECQDCVSAKMTAIGRCSRDKPAPVLDRAFIGLWRSTAGLRMRVVQNSQGFTGTLDWTPPKLRKRYPTDGVMVLKAKPQKPGHYQGRLLAPSGQWVLATYVLTGDREMVSQHPGGKTVRWRKTVEMKFQDHRPVPGGPPPPGVPPQGR